VSNAQLVVSICCGKEFAMIRPKTKILVDGGDPTETARVKQLLGFVDGQTTNPTLISKNPHIKQLLDAGHRLSQKEELNEYKKIVREISPLVGGRRRLHRGLRRSHHHSPAMLDQAREMFSWVPNAYIKFPCISEGLGAAESAVQRGIRVNMTLAFRNSRWPRFTPRPKIPKCPFTFPRLSAAWTTSAKTAWT
jgi:transaldolase